MERTAPVQGRSAEGAPASPALEPAIDLTGLRKDFGDRTALAGVDLRVEPGESVAVLGPNGSGKSTLLRILAGLLRPTSGEVSVLGCDLPKETHRLRGRVGYLGHEPLLYRDLSPRENLELAAALHGIEAEAAGPRIEALLEAVGMSSRAGDRVAELSAGMKQRIDICRAVLHEPALLLLDEPDAHLDPDARRRLAPLIAAGNGRTRVVVSHDRGRQPRRPPTSCWSSDDPVRRPAAQGPAGGAAHAALPPGDGALRRHRLRHLPLRARPDQPRRGARGRRPGADPAVRRTPRHQPALRRRARGGRLRPGPVGPGRRHRPLRREGERAGHLPGRAGAGRGADLRPLLPRLRRRDCCPSPSSSCWPTSVSPPPGR